MTMPETAVHEHDRAQSGKHDVGLARQIKTVDAEPEATPVQETTDQFLRFRVTATNPGHHAAARGAVYNICH